MMVLDRSKLDIRIELERDCVSPTDALNGVVHIAVLKDVTIGGVSVKIQGREVSINYDSKNKILRRAIEQKSYTHYRQIIHVFPASDTASSSGQRASSPSGAEGGSSSKRILLSQGSTYAIPFTCALPSDIPPSLFCMTDQATQCTIKYAVTVTARIPNGFDAETSRIFFVSCAVPYSQFLDMVRNPVVCAPQTPAPGSPSSPTGMVKRLFGKLKESNFVACTLVVYPPLLAVHHQWTPEETLLLQNAVDANNHTSTTTTGGSGGKQEKYADPLADGTREDIDSSQAPAGHAAVGDYTALDSDVCVSRRSSTNLLTVRLHLQNLTVEEPIHTVEVCLRQHIRIKLFLTVAHDLQLIASNRCVLPKPVAMGEETTVTVTLDVPSDVRACEELSSQLPLPTVETKTLRVETMLEVTFPGAGVSNPVREPGLVYVSSVVDRDDVAKPMPQVFNVSIKPPIDYQLGPEHGSREAQYLCTA